MSVYVMGAVWDLVLTTSRKIVLLKMADHADRDGANVYPSVGRIARECGLGERTVYRILAEFTEVAVLLVEAEGGGRGKATRYRIDVARARALYAAGAEEGAAEGSETAEEAPGDPRLNPATVAGFPAAENPATGDRNPATGDAKPCQALAGEPSLTVKNPGAAVAARPADGAPAPADAEPESAPRDPSLMQRWRALWPALEAHPAWPVMRRAVPDGDDGDTLTLAVESPGLGWALLLLARDAIEQASGRQLACVVRPWVQLRLVETGIMHPGTASPKPHPCNGNEVTLEDEAWRVWCGGRERDPGAAWERLWPDGMEQGATLLVVSADIRARLWLEEGGGARLAKALECPLRGSFAVWIDAVLQALAACRRQARERGAAAPLDDAAWDAKRGAVVERDLLGAGSGA